MTSILLAQATGNPRTDLLEITSGNIDGVRTSFDTLWDSVLHGAMFAELVRVSGAIAVMLIGWHFLRLVISFDGGHAFQYRQSADIIWAVIVTVLIAAPAPSSSGYPDTILTSALTDFRTAANTTTAIVRDSLFADYQRFQESPLKEAQVKAQAQVVLSMGLRECLGLTDPGERNRCLSDVREEVEQLVNPYYRNNDESWAAVFVREVSDALTQVARFEDFGLGQNVSGQIQAVIYDASAGWGGVARPAFTTLIIGVLYAWSAAFEWILEIAFLLTAVISPIYIALTLLPGTARMILTWLTAFFSVFMAKLGFTIVVGLVSYLMLDNVSSNPLVGAFVIALAAPVVSLMLASGGGLAIFSGLAGLGAAVAGRIGRR